MGPGISDPMKWLVLKRSKYLQCLPIKRVFLFPIVIVIVERIVGVCRRWKLRSSSTDFIKTVQYLSRWTGVGGNRDNSTCTTTDTARAFSSG